MTAVAFVVDDRGDLVKVPELVSCSACMQQVDGAEAFVTRRCPSCDSPIRVRSRKVPAPPKVKHPRQRVLEAVAGDPVNLPGEGRQVVRQKCEARSRHGPACRRARL